MTDHQTKGQLRSPPGLKPPPDLPPRLRDYPGRFDIDAYTEAKERQLIQEWRFSENGIPTFTVTPHPQVLTDKGFPSDFLWISETPKTENAQNLDSNFGQNVWWHMVRRKATEDQKFWGWVQKLMGSNVCLVEATSKKGAGWVRFNPEPQQNEGKDLSSSAPGRRAATRGASGLRNEV